MRYQDLEPGDVIFPIGNEAPWVVLAVDDDTMTYVNLAKGRVSQTDRYSGIGGEHFDPCVQIFREGSLLSTSPVR